MNGPFYYRKKVEKVDPHDKHTQEEIDAADEEMRQESEYDEWAQNEIDELRSECDWVDE